jgi:hypothetical protein
VFTSPIKILLICSVRMSLIQDFNKRDIAFLKCVILAIAVLPRILRDYRVEVYFTYGQNNSTRSRQFHGKIRHVLEPGL